MDIKGILSTIASVAGDVTGLGILKEAGKALEEHETTPEQQEILQQKVGEFILANYQQEIEDRADARAREIAIARTGKKDNIIKILAIAIVTAFITTIFLVILGVGKVESALAGTLIGFLSAKAEQIVAYYFGSSSGSKAKDDIIKNLKNGK